MALKRAPPRQIPAPIRRAPEAERPCEPGLRHLVVKKTREGERLSLTELVCAPAFDPDDSEGARVRQIVGAVEKPGFEAIRARRFEEAATAVRTGPM
ncbi:MAG: hypothetical protein ABR970_20090 [Roseiarcus sp.]